MADDDMPPPLEDMTDTLHQAKRLRDIKLGRLDQTRSSSAASKSTPAPHRTTVLPNGNDTSKKTSPPAPAAAPKSSTQSITSVSTEQTKAAQAASNTAPSTKSGAGDFGGLKKGFLFGGPKPSSAVKTQKPKSDSLQSNSSGPTDSIPLIKPKTQDKDSGLKLDEVQQAMESTKGFLQDKEWVTEGLLEKVAKSETLSKRLGDPRFMQAVAEFQSNPGAAMTKYQHNPEMQQFLKEFCGILGTHFTSMGEKQDSASVAAQKPAPSPTGPKITEIVDGDTAAQAPSPQESAYPVDPHVQQILSNPANQEILMDPKIQQLIENLRNDPNKAQRMLREGDHAFKQKVDRLISLGLLKFQG